MRALPRKVQAGQGFPLQSFFVEIQGKKRIYASIPNAVNRYSQILY